MSYYYYPANDTWDNCLITVSRWWSFVFLRVKNNPLQIRPKGGYDAEHDYLGVNCAGSELKIECRYLFWWLPLSVEFYPNPMFGRAEIDWSPIHPQYVNRTRRDQSLDRVPVDWESRIGGATTVNWSLSRRRSPQYLLINSQCQAVTKTGTERRGHKIGQ